MGKKYDEIPKTRSLYKIDFGDPISVKHIVPVQNFLPNTRSLRSRASQTGNFFFGFLGGGSIHWPRGSGGFAPRETVDTIWTKKSNLRTKKTHFSDKKIGVRKTENEHHGEQKYKKNTTKQPRKKSPKCIQENAMLFPCHFFLCSNSWGQANSHRTKRRKHIADHTPSTPRNRSKIDARSAPGRTQKVAAGVLPKASKKCLRGALASFFF